MKLRGRFTLALSLAALVPIAIAAVVTREVVAQRSRDSYEVQRGMTRRMAQQAIESVRTGMRTTIKTLASPGHPYVAALAREVAKSDNHLDPAMARRFADGWTTALHQAQLAELTIVGPDTATSHNVVLVGHSRGIEKPEIRRLANVSHGVNTYFSYRTIWDERGGKSPALVVEGGALSIDDEAPALSLALVAARTVGTELLDPVRGDRNDDLIDARLVRPTGEVIVEPRQADGWGEASDAIRVPVPGADDQPVAFVEITVDDTTEALLRSVTRWSVALALGALGGTVLIGLVVARRTARNLDQLVAGSLAAARGDLDHRVPVRSNDEVGAVASAFNFMMEDLKTSKERLVIAERIAAWQEIARRLAHEIKNPLTPIQMAMDTLRKSWRKQHPSFTEILEESTTTVLQEADRLKHIVTEFSDFARMPKPEFGRVDFNDLVRGALKLYQGAVAVELKLADPLPSLDADRNQVSQVLLNLVENARDAISQRIDPATGRITVSTRLGEAADRVMLVVEDNGPGVPADLKDKVFAPYFTTKHAKGGTGLGLAIVHRIVSDHGGRITISDARGGGARFTIELPLRNGTSLLASRF
jgi:signal transduction histidine kinase